MLQHLTFSVALMMFMTLYKINVNTVAVVARKRSGIMTQTTARYIYGFTK
jgi:hypothetical protein